MIPRCDFFVIKLHGFKADILKVLAPIMFPKIVVRCPSLRGIWFSFLYFRCWVLRYCFCLIFVAVFAVCPCCHSIAGRFGLALSWWKTYVVFAIVPDFAVALFLLRFVLAGKSFSGVSYVIRER